MGRKAGRKSEKVHKITEAEYAEYIMSLKDETPPLAYRTFVSDRSAKSLMHLVMHSAEKTL